MSLSIVIPCYNEQANIDKVIHRLVKYLPDAELIVVDDGSTDGSRERLQVYADKNILTLAIHHKNKGKGAAIVTGFKLISRELVVIQDADLEYHPRDIHQLVEPLKAGRADVVYGSRFKQKVKPKGAAWQHYWANRFLTWLSNRMTGLKLTDMETCYKAFNRSVVQQLCIREKRFGVEPEITAKIAKRNCRIEEVGISYAARTTAEGKKIGFKDGLRAIWCIFLYRFSNK